MHCFKIILIDPGLYWSWPLTMETRVFEALSLFLRFVLTQNGYTSEPLIKFYLNLQ